eukprot:9470882-Pyramimonas_sp.AAC.1
MTRFWMLSVLLTLVGLRASPAASKAAGSAGGAGALLLLLPLLGCSCTATWAAPCPAAEAAGAAEDAGAAGAVSCCGSDGCSALTLGGLPGPRGGGPFGRTLAPGRKNRSMAWDV